MFVYFRMDFMSLGGSGACIQNKEGKFRVSFPNIPTSPRRVARFEKFRVPQTGAGEAIPTKQREDSNGKKSLI